ncbi:MAG TPA: Ig-like domain-containing protein [Fervidobacterium sp.]|nr:Ig-like domain-containing protein [Fervidobacterium sp.]
MRRTAYLVVLSALCIILLLVSCTGPVKKDIFINISLTGEAVNINYAKFSTTPANFQDNIAVNKYKVYLYQDGKVVYQQESTSVSNNTISLHLTTINSGTYTLRVEAFKDTTPIFYGEKVVQLSYGQNNTQLTTYFNKAKLTVDVENQAEGFELTELGIEGSLPASPTNNFVENASFQNKEIYPGVWEINLEATLTISGDQKTVKWTKLCEIYPSRDKVLGLVIKSDDFGNVYIDLLIEVDLVYLDKVWGMRAERNEAGLKLIWDYNLPATFRVYKGTGQPGDDIEFIGSTTEKYFVDTNPVSNKNHYYINAIYGGKESGLCELVIDLQSPQVTIVNPTNGATVTGLVTITAEVQDNVGVSKVEFYIDGTKVGEDTSEPYQCNWDTIGLTNDSTHTIQAKAYDIIGNPGQSNIVAVRVVNNIPQVRIVNPTDGEPLHGTVTILAEAQDNEGIAQVEFSANDKFLKDFISSPYEYAWNTYGVIDGTYTLKAKATNLSGNQNSESINVIVNNGQKTFGGSGNDYARSVKQTTDGGYIVAGSTASFGAGGYDVYILKLDSNENLVWQKTFGGNGNDEAYSIQQTTDGGYIVAGDTSSFGNGGYDVYIQKLNSNGTLIWQKTFGGNSFDEAYSIQQTTDGGYIVAGYTHSFGAFYGDAYVLKLNSDGSLAWQKTFDRNGDDWANSVQETIDGGYIVAGCTYPFKDFDVYILKLNSDGSLAWQETFVGDVGNDEAYSIQQTTDGGYIVAGYTHSFGAGCYDAYILKLNSDGSLAWQNAYGGSGYDYACSIQQTTDGGYIVAGHTGSFGAGYEDVYVLKLNSDGSLTWQKTFGGSNYDEAYAVELTADGGYIVAGYTRSFGAVNYDAYILKLDSNGELHPFQ